MQLLRQYLYFCTSKESKLIHEAVDSWWKLVPVESKKGAHSLKAQLYLVIKLHLRPNRPQGHSGRETLLFQRVQSVTNVEEDNLMRMQRLVAWEQGRNRVHSAAQSHVLLLSSICTWLILSYICMYVAIHT